MVTLSNQAKAAAAKAQSDQDAADRFQAYVESSRLSSAEANAGDTLRGILDANTPPADQQPATTSATSSGAQIEAIVARIKTLAGASQQQQFQPFTPTKTLSNSLTFGGYTLTLDTNASTQYFGIELGGDGVQAYNKHFGPRDGAAGSTAVRPGVEISIGIPNNNNQAIDAITITQNLTTASSVTTSSSSAGSTSESSVSAQSSSITFLVNYATGQISVEQSAATVSARST